MVNNDPELKLLVLREITKVIRGIETDRTKVLTVGNVLQYIEQAITNVKTEKSKS